MKVLFLILLSIPFFATADEEVKLINRVLTDLNGLLDKDLDLDEVNADRYYPKDKDDVFS